MRILKRIIYQLINRYLLWDDKTRLIFSSLIILFTFILIGAVGLPGWIVIMPILGLVLLNQFLRSKSSYAIEVDISGKQSSFEASDFKYRKKDNLLSFTEKITGKKMSVKPDLFNVVRVVRPL